MITSRTNPLVRKFRKLRLELPDSTRKVVIEGIRLIEEGLKSNVGFEALFFAPKITQAGRGKVLVDLISRKTEESHPVSEEVMEVLSLEETPPGILAVVQVPHHPIESSHGLLLVLCGIRDPGNAGSLLRTAEGASFSVWFSEDSVHPLHHKVVKASMGSAFRVPFERGALAPFLQRLKKRGVKLVGTKTRGGISYENWNWRPPFALLLGGEAEGLPESIEPFLDGCVSIKLGGMVESLNVAAAGAVIMFEARRHQNLG